MSARASNFSSVKIPEAPHLRVEQDSPLSRCTTWRIGGPADFLVRTANPDDLIAAVRWAREEGMPVTLIGGGSNLLVDDGGIRGLVVVSKAPGERSGDLVQWEDFGDDVRKVGGR